MITKPCKALVILRFNKENCERPVQCTSNQHIYQWRYTTSKLKEKKKKKLKKKFLEIDTKLHLKASPSKALFV